MRYLVLACDYDETLAPGGRVEAPTLDALRKLRETGRKVLLVTGRELPDLLALLPEPELFDRIVAENGALLYRPASREERPLADPPPESLVLELTRRRIAPLSVGRVIVATSVPNETVVLGVIRRLGLERQVIFNKGAVMILPSGVNKATGLDAALEELGLSRHNCVAVGDAENDHAFLGRAECGIAVANALPALKKIADFVTAGTAGVGVRELIEAMMASDLAELAPRLGRHAIPLGSQRDGNTLDWPPYGKSLLVAGPSGSGKSTFTTGVLERLAEKGYQYCIIDPEGDYVSLPGAVVLGDSERAPTVAEMLDVLKTPSQNVVVNLLGLSLESRPEFFASAFGRLQELRIKVGRPHWIIADEAHHVMPTSWSGAALALSQALGGMLMITVHPGEVATAMLAAVDALVAVGQTPRPVIEELAGAVRRPVPAQIPDTIEPGEVLLWALADGTVERLRGIPSRSERRRHVRKYSEGELDEDRSFYFRGPEDKLNLRAQNLALFLQVGEGVDEATWLHHFRQSDFSRWFRTAIKDDELAGEVAELEARPDLSAEDGRALVREAVSQRYTV
jgi:hydroxymethylpyrimidine pyrophosphatase-like HAD family hydrolase